MIFHAVSMVAVFVDQVTQAPVVIQCAPSSGQDPLWARLFFAAIPSIFALGITWVAFRLNTGKEETQWKRNQQESHEQWLRDHKMAEWSELLNSLSKIKGSYFPIFKSEADVEKFLNEYVQIIDNLDAASISFLFIAQTLIESGFHEDLGHFMNTANISRKELQRELLEWAGGQNSKPIDAIEKIYLEMTDEFYTLVRETRMCAERDLRIIEPIPDIPPA
jgi:hypothetical protein